MPLPYIPTALQVPVQPLHPLPDSPPRSVSPPPPSPERPLSPLQLRSVNQPAQQPTALQVPLQETRGRPQINEDGSVHAYTQPFTTSDLLNWKHDTTSYLEKSQAMTDLLGSTPHYLR